MRRTKVYIGFQYTTLYQIEYTYRTKTAFYMFQTQHTTTICMIHTHNDDLYNTTNDIKSTYIVAYIEYWAYIMYDIAIVRLYFQKKIIEC